MKFFERLFRGGQASAEEPAPKRETVVPDELVKQFPAPPEKLQAILQKVPNTDLLLFEREMGCLEMSKNWKYWALDMLESGFETPGIIQLAGTDSDFNSYDFAALLEKIIQELALEVPEGTIYYAYILSLAQGVLLGEQTAKSAFKTLSDTYLQYDFERGPFWDFFYCQTRPRVWRAAPANGNRRVCERTISKNGCTNTSRNWSAPIDLIASPPLS